MKMFNLLAIFFSTISLHTINALTVQGAAIEIHTNLDLLSFDELAQECADPGQDATACALLSFKTLKTSGQTIEEILQDYPSEIVAFILERSRHSKKALGQLSPDAQNLSSTAQKASSSWHRSFFPEIVDCFQQKWLLAIKKKELEALKQEAQTKKKINEKLQTTLDKANEAKAAYIACNK